MIRLLLLGNQGQLGWELHRSLAPLGELVALDQPQLDLTDLESLRAVIRSSHPDVILNATAYTAVDRAESEPYLAQRINVHAPEAMAEEALRLPAALIHYSTDFVFNGETDRPYTEADAPDPLNVYGATKLAGEQAIRAVGGAYLILRTSWVYSLRRKCFVTQVLGWARNSRNLRLASDQYGSPTWSRILAETTALLIARLGGSPRDRLREVAGLYHLAGDGAASRHEWGKLVLELDPRPEEHQVEDVGPASESEFAAPARRPRYSALDCGRFRSTFGLQLPDWKEALRMAMAEA